MPAHTLADAKCRAAKAAGALRKLFDGGGLHLCVMQAGAKAWRVACRPHGKPRTMSLGPCPDVSLAETRAKRNAARALEMHVLPIIERARVKQLRVEVAAALEQYGIDVETFMRFAVESWHSEDWGRSPELLARATALLQQVGPPLVRLHMPLQGLNVPMDRFALYAARRFGSEHWQLDPGVVARAIRDVERHASDPDALCALIETGPDAA